MNPNILITGANRGIGAALTRALAVQGYHVTLLCRDSEAAKAFLQSLPSRHVCRVLEADLGTLAGIRQAALDIASLPPLGCLVHNAALWPHARILTPDGYEQSFVVNHLAPFMINLALEEKWQREGTRIVQMTAGLYPLGDRNIQASATGENFSTLRTYASTKLLNLVTTMTFAERWQGRGASIVAVHPGVVRTDLGAMTGAKGFLLKLIKRLWLTPEDGAQAPLRLCIDPGLQGVSGRFYDRFKEAPLAPFMDDPDFRKAVWQQAMECSAWQENSSEGRKHPKGF